MGGWEGKEHLRLEISKRKSRIQNRKHELTINHNIVNETARKQNRNQSKLFETQMKPFRNPNRNNLLLRSTVDRKNTKMIGNIRLKQFVNSIK